MKNKVERFYPFTFGAGGIISFLSFVYFSETPFGLFIFLFGLILLLWPLLILMNDSDSEETKVNGG